MNSMGKSTKTKSAKKRVKVGKLSTKTKLTGNRMKKVRGGFTTDLIIDVSGVKTKVPRAGLRLPAGSQG
jgi:hypothetical protein